MLIDQDLYLDENQKTSIERKIERSGLSNIEKARYKRELKKDFFLLPEDICLIIQDIVDRLSDDSTACQTMELVLNHCNALLTRYFTSNSVSYLLDFYLQPSITKTDESQLKKFWHYAFKDIGKRSKVFDSYDIEKASMWVDSLSVDQRIDYITSSATKKKDLFSDKNIIINTDNKSKDAAVLSYLFNNCTQTFSPFLRISSSAESPDTSRRQNLLLDLISSKSDQLLKRMSDSILFGQPAIAIECHPCHGVTGRPIMTIEELRTYQHDEFGIELERVRDWD